MKFIPARVHGILDYLVGILLLLVPNVFGFAEVGGPAVWIPRVLGIAVIVLALLTNYPVGLMKVIPMSVHLIIDYIAGIFLAASPFLFGFADADANVWMPHVIAGIAVFLITLFTQSWSETEIEADRTASASTHTPRPL